MTVPEDLESPPLAAAPAPAPTAVDASVSVSSVLIMLTSRSDVELSDTLVRIWKDEDIPNFAEFSTLLLEVPESPEEFERYRQDVRLAELAGTNIVWMAGSVASPVLLREIAGGETYQFRNPIDVSQVEIVDRRFESIFVPGTRIHHAFQIRGENVPVAYRGNPDLTTALICEGGRGATVVLPKPEGEAGYRRYVTVLKDLKQRRSPAQQAARNVLVGLIVPFLLTALVMMLRYAQKDFNEHHLDVESRGLSFIAERPHTPMVDLLERFAPADIQRFLELRDGNVLDEAMDGHAMVFYEKFGFYAKADAYFRAVRERRNLDAPNTDGAIVEYAQAIHEEMHAALSGSLFEPARYQAQKYINATKVLRPGPYIAFSGNELDQARKVISLVRVNYLYDEHPAIETYIRQLSDDEFHSPSIAEMGSTHVHHPSVTDNIAYSGIAATVGERSHRDNAAAWHAFQRRFPASDQIEDAAFNEISSLMNTYRGLSDDDLRKLNVQTIALCDDFVRRFPRSPLTDDALYYKFKMSTTLRDDRLMWSALARLALLPESDSFRRLQYVLATFWEKRKPITPEGRAFCDYVVSIAPSMYAKHHAVEPSDDVRATVAAFIDMPISDTRRMPFPFICSELIINAFYFYET